MPEGVRLDKWMWAARLVKTRALAVDAIKGGRVNVNDAAAKPSRDVHVGDRIELRTGALRRTVVVLALSDKRGPAPTAALLYEETPESREARELFLAQRRMEPRPQPGGGGRPTKRDRRRFEQARGRD